LIQVLIQRGYESDPVKAWKEAQNKVTLVSSSLNRSELASISEAHNA